MGYQSAGHSPFARRGAYIGSMTDLRRVLVIGYPAAELLDIACITTTLQMANYYGEERRYALTLAAPGGGTISTATGLVLQSDTALERVRGPFDTLVVAGGLGYLAAMDDPVLVAHVRRLARVTRRVASVCTGAGVLAAAGLLDGRRATTHWDQARVLARRYPEVTFDDEPIHLVDDGVHTSAGVTAALDLMLAFISDDAGPDLARVVSRQLVTYLQRPGNQAQMSMFTAAPAPGSSLVRDVVAHVESHLDADLSVSALADLVGVSERHLGRLFHDEMSMSPGTFVRRSRVEAAAHLLTGTDLTIAGVALRCGYSTVETLRQAFRRAYGVSPSHYRSTQAVAGAGDSLGH